MEEKERKQLIIAGRRLQVFVHIKRRALERNVFFPLVKRQILEETAFPKEVRHQYVKTYIAYGTVLLTQGYKVLGYIENFLSDVVFHLRFR